MSGLIGASPHEEKQALLSVIETIYGRDSTLALQVGSFNQRTVEAVEEVLVTLSQCNASMKSLVASLVGGSAMLAKGWLRRVLKGLSDGLNSDSIRFDGIACRNVVAASAKSHIHLTLY